MRVNWTNKMENELVRLKEEGLTWEDISQSMSDAFGLYFTSESCRNKYRSLKKFTNENKDQYKETESINYEKGIAHSDKLIEIDDKENITEYELLRAHGFDPNEWKITKANNSMWHHHNKQDGTKVLLASKIDVKKKQDGLNWDELLETIQSIEPITYNVPRYKIKHKQLLEIPLFDQHFGVNTYDDYKQTQSRIINLITSRVWEQVVITIGSDMLHHNDHRNRTAKGTEIQHVDMVDAWEQARMFFEPVIQKALINSNKVKIYYIKGNHDESLSWAFTKMLEQMFPQIEFDTGFEERKVHLFENIFIGYTHGDKGKNRIPRLFPAEFPEQWANAKVRELHAGHIHHEVVKDEYGITMRSMATRARTDQWHRDNGYVGANKRFMVFEYSTDELEAIHYV